jgi:hypothetical protein
LASFERHEELIVGRFHEPIISENAAFERVTNQSGISKKDREPQLLALCFSHVSREHCRGIFGLQPAIENSEPIPGLFEYYYKNMQDHAVVAEIVVQASMEEGDEGEKIPEEHSPDEASGFHVDHSIHHWGWDQLQEIRWEA